MVSLKQLLMFLVAGVSFGIRRGAVGRVGGLVWSVCCGGCLHG